MELGILLRLLMAHLLGDFLLQPLSWVKAKERKKEKAPQMYYHVLVVTVLTYVFLWDWDKWYFPMIVLVSHLAIDIWKSHRPNNFLYFLFDQLLHLTVIFLIWVVVYFDCHWITAWAVKYLNSPHFWTLILSYYLVIGPLGIAIGKATEKWQKEAAMDTGGLSKAGMWIGRCERVLILTFIISNQYTALGFLMAAKSILRFGDKDDREQKKTEYILVGTLISFSSAAIVGVIANCILKT
ncbi:DUF3307 domain-containing protein [Mucilaginibacter sp. NFX135]|uniref:DUF3307 domain-containing protein n=1 Tax=Mucilaginibacter sp. NFX135 TaxID=3402687 RepID=UPI003AFA4A2A